MCLFSRRFYLKHSTGGDSNLNPLDLQANALPLNYTQCMQAGRQKGRTVTQLHKCWGVVIGVSRYSHTNELPV